MVEAVTWPYWNSMIESRQPILREVTTPAGKSVVILGGGVTGLTVAAEVAGDANHHVLLLEKAPHLGGLASTFQVDGHTFDTGSHRLHDECAPAVAQLLQELCGDDLLKRERYGLIYV